MADSYIDFGVSGDLSSDQQDGEFSGLTLDYIDASHIGVTHTTAAGVKTVLTSSNITVTGSPGSFTVTIDSGVSLPLAASDTVRITRTTPVSSLERTFSDGSVLKASDLNTQNKQALFGVQEQVDGGIGSLPIDVDDKYDAGDRVIKNVGTPTNQTDAVTKDYVDNISIFGGAFGGTDPQFWSFTTAIGDVSGSDRVYTLVSPTASSTTDNMYLVEVSGVIQSPATYNVTESDGEYTLTLVGAATGIDVDTEIVVRNFGVSRNIVQQPYVNPDTDTAALIVRQLDSGTDANLQEWQDHTSTVKAKVEVDGDATFVDVTADDISSATITTTGNASVGGTANIVGNTTVNTDKVVINAADGNTTVAGTLGVTGATTLSGGASVTGNVSATGNVTTTDGNISTTAGDVSGVNVTATGTANVDNLIVTGSSTKGIISDDQSTHHGRFWHSTSGAAMQYDAGSGVTGGRVICKSSEVQVNESLNAVNGFKNFLAFRFTATSSPSVKHAYGCSGVSVEFDDDHQTYGRWIVDTGLTANPGSTTHNMIIVCQAHEDSISASGGKGNIIVDRTVTGHDKFAVQIIDPNGPANIGTQSEIDEIHCMVWVGAS